MTAKGYTSALKIALLLGQEGYAALSVNQADRLSGGLIEAAERWIDGYTGRAWLEGGTVTAERHELTNGRVWLNQRPITAVTAVRLGSPFWSLSTLTAGSDYVVDLTRGLLTFRSFTRLNTWSSALREVEVDYTAPQTVPADVAEAAGLIVAGWLQAEQAQAGAASLYKSISTDGQQLVYRDHATVGAIPAEAERLLGHYCRPVLV